MLDVGVDVHGPCQCVDTGGDEGRDRKKDRVEYTVRGHSRRTKREIGQKGIKREVGTLEY